MNPRVSSVGSRQLHQGPQHLHRVCLNRTNEQVLWLTETGAMLWRRHGRCSAQAPSHGSRGSTESAGAQAYTDGPMRDAAARTAS